MLIETPNTRLRRAVFARLVAHPLVSTCHLNVMAEGGVVALCGYVTSHAQKDAAWRTARRVSGVTFVTNDIQVALPDPSRESYTADGESRRSRLTLSTSARPLQHHSGA